MRVGHPCMKREHPAYINSKFTVKEGRRIPASLACENPSSHEIMESVMRMGYTGKSDLEVRLGFSGVQWRKAVVGRKPLE